MLVMLEEGVNSRASFASTLRLLLDEPGAPHVQEFEQFLVLLSSSDFEVQSEAQALLVLLVTKSPDLLPHVLEDLFELINTRGTADADEVCERERQPCRGVNAFRSSIQTQARPSCTG